MLNPSLIDEQTATLPELYADELPGILRGKLPDLSGIRRVYALGNGDSCHAAQAAAEAFAAWTEMTYLPMPAYTFLTRELPRLTSARAEETLIVCISASGSSKLAVNILNEVRSRGVGHTLSLSGKPGSAMDQAAEWAVSTAIAEKGRSPGIRTYAASFAGLLALACRMGGRNAETVIEQLQSEAARMPAWMERAGQMADELAGWDWPLASILGCDGLLGCARFAAAKFAEGCGLYAAGQELEEWCHVESMTYPLSAPVILLQGIEAEEAKAVRVADTAHRAGRKVMMVCSGSESEQLRKAADAAIFLDLKCESTLYPLFHYIPLLPVTSAMAARWGRAMFLSDQPFKLF